MIPETNNNNEHRPILLGNLLNENYGTSFAGNVYSKKGLCPTLRSSEGGTNNHISYLGKSLMKKVIKVGNIYASLGQNGNVYDLHGLSPTIISGTTDNISNGGIGSNNSPKIIIKKGESKK